MLHAIREYTLSLAKGQSWFGTFGHGISRLTPEGKLHGAIPPYGPVNMAGLPGNLAIVMGKKCGVSDPEVDAAIARAAGFFGYFADKGSIPYGEHEPAGRSSPRFQKVRLVKCNVVSAAPDRLKSLTTLLPLLHTFAVWRIRFFVGDG